MKKSTSLLWLYHILMIGITSLLFALLMKINLFGSMVLFYRGVFILVLLSLSLAIVATILKHYILKSILLHKDTILLVIVFFCINLTFFVIVPVTIERSISVFLLESVLSSNEPLSEKEIEQRLIEDYVRRNSAIAKRMNEQIVSGNVSQENDKYILSSQGTKTVQMFQFFENMYLPHTMHGSAH